MYIYTMRCLQLFLYIPMHHEFSLIGTGTLKFKLLATRDCLK